MKINQTIECTNSSSLKSRNYLNVFKSLSLVFALTGGLLAISPQAAAESLLNDKNETSEQQKTVKQLSGVVKDDQGNALVGVTVSVKNSTKATMTDADGKYVLENVPVNSIIEFMFVGMKTVELPLEGRAVLNVDMKNDAILLDEVVVVGYTAQKKGLVTGAVVSVNVTENMKTIPTTSAGNLLSGKMAGVSVSTPRGIPGAEPAISVRTGSSWNTQSVLYVIDGVVTEDASRFNTLSPNEIESVTTLKDAASAAIYGSRSAGGVMIVTTKRGALGKPQFNYSYQYAIDTRTKNMELTSGVDVANQMNMTSGPTWGQDEIDWMSGINGGYGYDQLEEVWRNPSTQTHNISVSGGTERIKYYAGASYVKQQGFLDPTNYNRLNLRMNVTANITKDFQLYTSFSMSDAKRSQIVWEAEDGLYAKLRIFDPAKPVYTDGGKYVDYGWIANVGAMVNGDGGYNRSRTLRPEVNISGTYNLPYVPGLSAKASYSKSWDVFSQQQMYTNYDMHILKASGTYGHIVSTRDEDIVNVKRSTVYGSDYLEKKMNLHENMQINAQINYDRTFNEVHKVNATLVYEKQEGGRFNEVYGGRQNFPIYTTDQFWATSGTRADSWVGGEPTTKIGRASFIGQFGYVYDNKYIVNFNFREDGSMKFAKNQRWGFFPGGSAAWVLSEEKFWNKDKIQNFKLRAAVGLTGNDGVGGWQWQESYKAGNNSYFGDGPKRVNGLTYGNLVNPNLTWEKALSYNFGVDMTILKSFTIAAEYWYRDSYDILGDRQVSLPTSFSMNMPSENYGRMKAQGLELSLGYRGQSREFSYYANANISYGWNEVTKKDYAENAQPIDIPVGKSTSRMIGYDYVKMLRTQDDVDAWNAAHPKGYNHGGWKAFPGMLVYNDLGGPQGEPDGYIDGWDRVELRKNNFPIVYGLNLGGGWKGIKVDMQFQGNLGNDVYSYGICDNVEWQRSWKGWVDKAWTPDNINAKYPKRSKYYDGFRGTYHTGSSFWQNSGSFMRMKYLTVSYDIPQKVYNGVLENVRVFFTGTNLFILNKFSKKYYDIESGANSYPVMRSFTFGVDVKF